MYLALYGPEGFGDLRSPCRIGVVSNRRIGIWLGLQLSRFGAVRSWGGARLLAGASRGRSPPRGGDVRSSGRCGRMRS